MIPSFLKRLTLSIVLPFSLSAGAATEVTTSSTSDNSIHNPRNVILIIGDGMDDHQITIARNYLKGAQGQLTLDKMPLRGSVQVLTVEESAPQQAVYVADSANSATSMATGRRTSRGRIATSAQTDMDLKTIAEFAKNSGLGVGIVSTASVTDATPASFISHINQRFCEGPEKMIDAKVMGRLKTNCTDDLKSNGGKGSIAEQIADSDFDIILGGGMKYFTQPAEASTQTVADVAQTNNFQLITQTKELDNLPNNKNILGLFAKKHLPVRLQGEGGRKAEQPEPSLLNQIYWKLGDVTQPKAMACEDNPQYGNTPSLQQLTNAALNHLTAKYPDKGFFLMVESASIDKQAHARNPCGSIGELEQLDESLQAALSFAKKQPNTLIMVTADHGQAAQIVPNESLFEKAGAPVYSPGHIARITTPEGSTLAVNYATNLFPIAEHTGVNVPLFANEVGKNELSPMIKQTDIFMIMMNHLNLTTH